MLFKRPPRRTLSIHRRHLGLTVGMIFQKRAIKRMILAVAEQLSNTISTSLMMSLCSILEKLLKKYRQIAYIDVAKELRYNDPSKRSIAAWSNDEVYLNFRFLNRAQVFRLKDGFKFPEKITLQSRHEFSGEEAVLILLYRFHYPGRLTDMEKIFSRDYSTISRIFNWSINFMVTHWGHLLNNRMDYWRDSFPLFAKKINEKHIENGGVGSLNPRIFGFIDTTINAIARPSQGERLPGGAGVDQILEDVQRCFYTKYKKLHGLKFQTVGLPNGMHFHVSGPYSARHNDAYIYGKSHIEDSLRELQSGEPEQYKIHGDNAYTNTDYCTVQQLRKLRISIEWTYHEVKDFYKLIDYKRLLKIQLMNVGDLLFTALLLHNSYVAMNGSEASSYFDIAPPTFDSWIST